MVPLPLQHPVIGLHISGILSDSVFDTLSVSVGSQASAGRQVRVLAGLYLHQDQIQPGHARVIEDAFICGQAIRRHPGMQLLRKLHQPVYFLPDPVALSVMAGMIDLRIHGFRPPGGTPPGPAIQ